MAQCLQVWKALYFLNHQCEKILLLNQMTKFVLVYWIGYLQVTPQGKICLISMLPIQTCP